MAHTPTLHQQKTIDWLKTRHKALIAHEMGVGKTLCAIHAIGNKKALIIVPASLIQNWLEELYNENPNYQIGTNNKLEETQQIHIVSYEQINKAYPFIEQYNYLIADEAHYLKNRYSQRAIRFQTLIETIPKIILMTGTPALNNIEEMQTLLYYLGHPQTPDTPAELHQYIQTNDLMKRYTKKVLDLPDPIFRTRQTQIRSHSEITLIQNKIRELYELSEKNLDQLWENYRPILQGYLMQIRQHIGIAKIPDTIEQIQQLIDNNHHTIVFAHHKKVLEAISQTFDAPKIVGGMSAKKKQKSLQQFQQKQHQLIVCSIRAAGVGITLTKANHVVFAEFPWTPAEYDQAYSRTHRKGQTKTIYVTDMTAHHPLDMKHQHILKTKRHIVDLVTDGDNTYTQHVMEKELVSSLLETT